MLQTMWTRRSPRTGAALRFSPAAPEGGIYVIPTLGGEERLLVERGFSPRFSPDGMWIAYGVSESAGSQIYIAPSSGGPGTRIAPRVLPGPRSRVVARWDDAAFLGPARPRSPTGEQRGLVRCHA